MIKSAMLPQLKAFRMPAVALLLCLGVLCSDARAQYSILDTSKPYAGVIHGPITDEAARNAGLSSTDGVLILMTVPDAPLAKAGVREGDILLRADGQTLHSPEDLKRYLSECEVGHNMSLEIARKQERLTLECELFDVSVADRVKGVTHLADRGNHDAQLVLSTIYRLGPEGIPVDGEQSLKWLRRAADEGFSKAQLQLGTQYRFAILVERDLDEALKWFQKAADGGNVYGKIGIGAILYFDSKGDARNPAKAAEYFKQAAQQDVPLGWHNMGVMYWNGDYLKRNDEKAVACFRKALELGNLVDSHVTLGQAHEYGRGVTRNYPEAFRHYQQAAELGDAHGQFAVGVFYYSGYAVNRDPAKAAEWFEKAAAKGHVMAWNNLGLMYQNGDGVSRDLAKAKQLFESAAKAGNTLANANLGIIYEHGYGVEKDLAKAAENYLIAANDNNPNAQAAIGAMILDGKYFQRDDAAALKWIQKAAARPHATAERLMGYIYENGRAVPRDREEAIAWYLKAAEHGDKWAAERLKQLQQ